MQPLCCVVLFVRKATLKNEFSRSAGGIKSPAQNTKPATLKGATRKRAENRFTIPLQALCTPNGGKRVQASGFPGLGRVNLSLAKVLAQAAERSLN
jgi:hypothetical protein